MKNPITLNFMLFISFLVVGYSVSTKFFQSEYGNIFNVMSLMTTRNSNPIPTLNDGQRNILLIGVNTLDKSKAQLESLWLVTNLPSDSAINLLPIFPSGNENFSDFENQLLHSFNLSEKNGDLVLGEEFTKVLENNNYWWSGYFIIDHVAVMKILNLRGDAEVNRKVIEVNQPYAGLPAVVENPQSAFTNQLVIMRTACHQLAGLSENPDWSLVSSLIPTHIQSDLDFHQFTLEWEASFSVKHNPICTFPTLEVSWIDN